MPGAAPAPAPAHPPSGAPTHARALAYQPGLDGLRALAVASVVVFHGGLTWLPGGALGVDLFFVLSGYLISTLLLRELDRTGGVRLGHFYLRRVRRLLPALLLVLVGVAIYASTTPPDLRAATIRGDAIASLLYVANWRFISTGTSYFAEFRPPSPLLHVWSLAIEEQWYLVWPPVLTLVWRRSRGAKRVLVPLLAVLTVASAAWMAVVAHGAADPSRAYFGTDTRAQALLTGALLATLLHGVTPSRAAARAMETAGVAGLACCALMMLRFSGMSPRLYEGGFTLFAVASAAAIAAVMAGTGRLARLLALRPLPSVGRISYGLYLWHWPIDVWISPPRVGLPPAQLFVLRTAVALAVSTVSYLLVERPIRTAAWERFRRPVLTTAGSAVLAGALVLGGVGMAAGPDPSSNPAYRLTPPSPGDLRVLVVGDSVGWTLVEGATRPKGLWLANGAFLGCGVVGGTRLEGGRPVHDAVPLPCSREPEVWRHLLRYEPQLVVMSVGTWEIYDHLIDGRTYRVGTPEYRAVILAGLDRVRASLRQGTRAPIVLFDLPCMRERNASLGGASSERNDPARNAWVNQVLTDWAASHPDVQMLDWSSWLCPGGRFVERRNGVVLRPDGVHFNADSATVALAWLMPQLQAAAHR